MQGLVKAPARIRKFVPHAAVSHSSVVDSKEIRTPQPRVKGRRTIPMLKAEGFDQLAHDARNVLSALKLYCELLGEPGVLTEGNCHYAQELEAISETASRLVERLSAPRRAGLGSNGAPARRGSSLQKGEQTAGEPGGTAVADVSGSWMRGGVEDFGRELLEMRPLLAGIGGPRIELEIEAMPSAGRSQLSKEDFTRVMLNLVRNASEAMPEGGRLRITAQYGEGLSFLEPGLIADGRPRTVAITVEDSGPGIAKEMREKIFLPGFTTRQGGSGWPGRIHRGLGLSIVRDLVEAAGGMVRASSALGRGARFDLDLPVTSGMCQITNESRLVADVAGEACIECP